MIRREIAEPVIQYLHALTYNGELSAAEVWELANWLNQQSAETLENWPAEPLVKALQAAFNHNELTEAELEEVAGTIVAIEQLWVESYRLSPAEAAADESLSRTAVVEEGKPAVPSIPLTVEMPDPARNKSFTVDLEHHTCTCPEWIENRAAFPEGDYRRCCSHLTQAFRSLVSQEEELRRDPLFVAFVNEHGRRGKGAAVDVVWHVVVVNGIRVLYGASPASEWITVYAPVDGVYRKFGYNRKKQRWGFGHRPQGIAWQIASQFSQTQPQALSARNASGFGG